MCFNCTAIGEEVAFEDKPPVVSDRSSSVGPSGSGKSKASVDGGATMLNNKANSSPGGSLGSSSAVSRGSEAARSVKSLRSLKSQDRMASC